MLKSASLFICLLFLISATSTFTADIPEIDLDITSNASVNNSDIPHIDLIIKNNSTQIPHIDIPIKENSSIPHIDLNIKEDSKIPHIDIPIKENSSIPHIDLTIKENSTIPHIDLNIRDNSTQIPHIDIPINKTSEIPHIDLKIQHFQLPEVNLDIKTASNNTDEAQAHEKTDIPHIDLIIEEPKVPEIDLDIKENKNSEINDETEDDDEDEDVPEENNRGICDVTLITPVGKLYEKLVLANNKSHKLKADPQGILFLVVNTHTCLCKISGTALDKENRSEKPFLKIKPTEKELRTTYKFPFPVKSASFKCTNTA